MTGPDVAMAAPERIGRYELLIPIGTGGMGTVYLAHTELLPGVARQVAVKLMHPQLRADGDAARQLLHEATLAASIRHPHVVAVLEAGESPHGVFLVMDHVQGGTLASLIRAARKRGEHLPVRVVGKILRDALLGLHAAHELRDERGEPRHLVHRDFSPQNILVGRDGIGRLTDFGIAKALGQLGATATGIVKGKVGYMAPEQARGERIDRRSDVWAAGVVAWEALSGRRLFQGANDAATLLQVVSGKRPPLVSSARSELPPALAQAIAAALEPKPSRRLATAQVFRSRIEEALHQGGGLADDDEVAACVMELLGDRLDRQREQAARVLSLRDTIADLSASAEAQARSDAASNLGTPPDASEFHEISTRAAVTAASRSGPRGRWIAGAIALAAASGALVLATTTTPPAPAEPMALPSPAPPRAPALLRIEANEPIAQLRIDARTIVVVEATRAMEVPLGDGGARRLEAITRDGRKLEVALEAEQRHVRLEFAAASAAPTPRPRARPLPPPRTAEEPGLADSPYGSP